MNSTSSSPAPLATHHDPDLPLRAAAGEVSGTAPASAGGGTGAGPTPKRSGTRFRENSLTPVAIRTAKMTRQNTLGNDISSADDLVRNLGLDYQEVEKRTLTRWVNAQLSQVGDRIEKIETDLKDGKRLLKLLSVVSGQPTPKPERMNMRIHQLANVAQAFSFLAKDLGADALPDIGNEAIVNGDLKKTLALVFFIMLRYQVQAILNDHGENYMERLSALSEREQPLQDTASLAVGSDTSSITPDMERTASRLGQSGLRKADKADKTDKGPTSGEAKVALLYWVRIQLEDYIAARILPPVQDFSRSWRNGLAFCLLIHRHDPALMPQLFADYLQQDLFHPSTWHQLLTLAFQVADTHLHIPPYLDPEDLTDVEFPYEPSVMMYVSEYYKIMSHAQREEPEHVKRSKAAKRRAAIAWAVADSQEPETCHSPEPVLDDVQDTDHTADDAADQEVDAVMANRSVVSSPQPISPSPVPSPSPSPVAVKRLPTMATPTKTPPEAPVPIPIPSTRWRRSRPAHQRESTLAEQDKARIKADLNQRLQRQLTGHLPRGIHPTLDQLMTIHDTILSFIKVNTLTIDEIPDEFSSSKAIGEYMEALEIMEECLQDEATHLETAKTAHDQLTMNPEAADDTLIRLTDLQRTQVTKMYNALMVAWSDFVELVQNTKTDLVKLRQDMINTEQQVAAYEARAADVETAMSNFQHLIDTLAPRDADNHIIHPLDGTLEDHAQFERAVKDATNQLDNLETTVWKPYRAFYRELSPATHQAVADRDTHLQQQYDHLDQSLRQARRKCTLFKRGLAFAQVMVEVESDLATAQTLLDNDEQKTITDDMIQDLEARVKAVRTKMHGIREDYYDLFESKDTDQQALGFVNRLVAVEERYHTIRDWVDQVRGWFLEAGRIRDWIELRIATIEKRNANDDKDMLSESEPIRAVEAIRRQKEHGHLQREVERFDADDMSRLRDHVKQLTIVDRDRELSPADTLTIEITLETLNRLSCLMRLVRDRTTRIDTLMCRIRWEQAVEQATAWIQTTDQEVDGFLHKAHWTNSTLQGPVDKDATPLTETIVQTLVDLEHRVADFDQGLYSQVLDTTQELEDLSAAPLPAALETRRLALEQQLGALMQRISFARKVVEQHLAMADLVLSVDQCLAQGRALLRTFSASGANPGENSTHSEQLQRFNDRSAYLTTQAATRIPFPPDNSPVDADNEETRQNNAAIREWIESSSMALAVIAENMEAQLTEQRQYLSLRQRTDLVLDDLDRIAAWFDDNRNSLNSTEALLGFAANQSLDKQHVSHLAQEHRGMTDRLQHMERGDYANALECARQIEVALDEANTVAIDRQALIDALEHVEQCRTQFKTQLSHRAHQIHLSEEILAYEAQWTQAGEALLAIAYATWDVVRLMQYDRAETLSSTQEPHATLEALRVRYTDTVQQVIPPVEAKAAAIEEAGRQLNEEQQQNLGLLIATYRGRLNQKRQGLEHLLDYASTVLDQRDKLIDLFDQGAALQNKGKEILNALVKLQRRSIGMVDGEWEGRVHEFREATHHLCQTTIEEISAPVGLEALQWDFDETEHVDYHQRSQQRIQTNVEKQRKALLELEQSVTAHYTSYAATGHWKQQADQCTAETKAISLWISEQRKSLQHLDVELTQTAVLSEAEQAWIVSEKQAHEAREKDMDAFDRERVAKLQLAVDALAANTTHAHLNDAIVKSLEEINDDMALLKELAARRTAELNALTLRVTWETYCEDGMRQLRDLTNTIRHLTPFKVNVTDIEACTQHVTLLEQALDAVTAAKNTINVEQIQTAFNQLVNALSTIQSSDTGVPVHLEARMDAVQRAVQRLEVGLEERREQVAWMVQRLAWEKEVHDTLLTVEEQEARLKQFIQTEAQWSPEAIRQDRHSQLEEWCQTFRAEIESFAGSRRQSLEQQLTVLRQSATTQDTVEHLSDTALHAFQDLADKNERLQRHLAYATQVVAQYGYMQAFFSRTDALMATAESMKEAFLAAPPSDTHHETLETLAKEVQATCLQFGNAILFPACATDDTVSMAQQVEDQTAHEMMRDMIETRKSHLQELVTTLQHLLSSKATVTHCQMQQCLYQQHVQVFENWLNTRRAALDTQQQLLDQAATQPMAVAPLREALGMVQGLQRAMQQKDNLFAVLVQRFDAYVTAYDDTQGGAYTTHDEQFVQDFEDAMATQGRLTEHWDQLVRDTETLTRMWNTLLEPAERHHQATELIHALQQFEATMSDVDTVSITDDQIHQWQKRVDTWETHIHGRLQQQLSIPCEDTAPPSVIVLFQASQACMDTAKDMMAAIRTRLATLSNAVSMNRLRKTYLENADVAHRKMVQFNSDVKTTCQTFARVEGETAQERKKQREKLVSANNRLQEQMNDCKEAHDDLDADFSVLQTQGADHGEVGAMQAQLNEAWAETKRQQDALSALLSITGEWVERYTTLDRIQGELAALQNGDESQSRPVYLSYKSRRRPPTETKVDTPSFLAALEKSLGRLADELQTLEASAQAAAQQDTADNSGPFEQHRQRVLNKLATVEQSIGERKLVLEKATLLDSLSSEIKKQTALCEEQLVFVKQQAVANPTLAEKKVSVIQTVMQASSAALESIQMVLDQCKEELETTIAEGCERLAQVMTYPSSALERMKQPLVKAVNDLEQKMAVEQDYLAVLRLICEHADREAEMQNTLANYKATVTRFSRGARIAHTKGSLLPDLAEFDRRFKVIETAIYDYYQMAATLKTKVPDSVGSARIASLRRSIDRRKESVQREWARLKVFAEETRSKLEETQKQQHTFAKLSEALRIVHGLKQRVNALQPSGKSTEARDLKEIQEEVSGTLAKRIKDVDALLVSLSDKDGRLKRQRQELAAALEDMEKLIQFRQQQVNAEGSMATLSAIFDQMDEHMAQVSDLLDKCAPHHASMVQNRFDKTELQGMLSTLVANYKEQEIKMAELIDKAKIETRKPQASNSRMIERLQKTLEAWANLQSSAVAREQEFQTCIQQLDHEFFTKLAAVKTTAARDGNQRQRKPPTAPSNNRMSPVPRAKTPGARRPSFRGSMLTPDSGRPASAAGTRYRSRTPTATVSRDKSVPYVADPKNELDVQLGRIVNDSPYRMKVKRVQGEVGKYWFGDENPRLVYCRILPSKMVMVRVGGGWIELMRYLQDHNAKMDAREKTPSPANVGRNSPDVSGRATASGSRVHLKGGRQTPTSGSLESARSQSRSSSSCTQSSAPQQIGYMEGDQYIQVDREGNQVAFKLSKAKQDARTLPKGTTRNA